MSNIRFRSVEHQDFFLENMMKCRVNDCYHRAFSMLWGLPGKRGTTSTRCLILRTTVLCRRGCMEVGRQAERSRSAPCL